jgi:hypothetical protein
MKSLTALRVAMLRRGSLHQDAPDVLQYALAKRLHFVGVACAPRRVCWELGSRQ